MTDRVRWELAGGRVTPGTPWCVACNDPAEPSGHQECRAVLHALVWVPCLTCLGGGVDLDGCGSCADCMGLGFWQAGSEEHLVGGYTVIAEAVLGEREAEAAMRRAVGHGT